MKLMIIIVHDDDTENVVTTLVQQNFRVTRMASTGGFLRRGNSTLLVGAEDEQVQQVFDLIKANCCLHEGENQSRATAFVVNMAQYLRI